mmetsp:Transcript_17771/g.40715  ORF Transcript_17771/g.40715 Transcript_17771/m.40715 type:complete len:573 (+) Transcript_17771:2066-3784(+)
MPKSGAVGAGAGVGAPKLKTGAADVGAAAGAGGAGGSAKLAEASVERLGVALFLVKEKTRGLLVAVLPNAGEARAPLLGVKEKRRAERVAEGVPLRADATGAGGEKTAAGAGPGVAAGGAATALSCCLCELAFGALSELAAGRAGAGCGGKLGAIGGTTPIVGGSTASCLGLGSEKKKGAAAGVGVGAAWLDEAGTVEVEEGVDDGTVHCGSAALLKMGGALLKIGATLLLAARVLVTAAGALLKMGGGVRAAAGGCVAVGGWGRLASPKLLKPAAGAAVESAALRWAEAAAACSPAVFGADAMAGCADAARGAKGCCSSPAGMDVFGKRSGRPCTRLSGGVSISSSARRMRCAARHEAVLVASGARELGDADSELIRGCFTREAEGSLPKSALTAAVSSCSRTRFPLCGGAMQALVGVAVARADRGMAENCPPSATRRFADESGVDGGSPVDASELLAWLGGAKSHNVKRGAGLVNEHMGHALLSACMPSVPDAPTAPLVLNAEPKHVDESGAWNAETSLAGSPVDEPCPSSSAEEAKGQGAGCLRLLLSFTTHCRTMSVEVFKAEAEGSK